MSPISRSPFLRRLRASHREGSVLTWVLVLISAFLGVLVLWSFYVPPQPAPHPMIDLKVLHRSLATAIESYRVEKGAYPPQLGLTTTPIAYIASLDSFDDGPYRTRYSTVKDGWILVSDGPDGIFQLSSWRALDASSFVIYDPTNGATSDGDIIRTNLGVLDLSHLPEFVDVPDETDSPESEP